MVQAGIEEERTGASRLRIEEALVGLRHKEVQSTTLERFRRTWEADIAVRGLPQPLQLGEGVYHLLDTIRCSR